MDDARGRRHGAEVLDVLLAPAEERVALLVAVELELRVERRRVGAREVVDLHAVVDDEIDRDQRVDLLGVAAERRDGRAHGRDVDDDGHAGEVLQDHARGLERQLHGLGRLRVPGGEALDVGLGHAEVVAVAQDRLEQHPDRVGQLAQVRRDALLCERGEPVVVVGLAGGLEGGAGAEGVLGGHARVLVSAPRGVKRGGSRTPSPLADAATSAASPSRSPGRTWCRAPRPSSRRSCRRWPRTSKRSACRRARWSRRDRPRS